MSENEDVQFGESWWGREWIHSLDRLSTAWQNRLPRGRDYAAKGHVIALSVSTGKIQARVQGSRSKPYNTVIEVPTIEEDGWNRLIEELALKARYPAQLLNGQMPEGIQEIFDEINLNLFPARSSELLSSCTCPDKAKPCKHIVAVHYAFGQALDQDPFLLFLLRGASQEELLKRFHLCWFGNEESDDIDRNWSLTGGKNVGTPILPQSADRFNRSPEDENLEISVYVQRPEQDLLILERLSNPPTWTLPIHIKQLLGPVIEETSKMAFEFATSQGMGDEFGGDTVKIEEDERQSPYESLLEAFSVPEIVQQAAESAEDEGLSLPKSLPAAELLTGAIGVNTAAESENKEKQLRSERREQERGGAVRIRKKADGAAGVKRRRVVVTPGDDDTREKPPKEDLLASKSDDKPKKKKASDSDDVGPTVVRRKRVVAGGTGPVVRRRGRKVVGADEGDEEQSLRKKVVALDAKARRAWEDDKPEESFKATLEAWKLAPNEPRYMLLAANRDQVENSDDVLASECDRIIESGQRRGRRLQAPELLLLLTLGRFEEATDFVVDMEDEVWKTRDGVASVYLPFAMMALVGEREVPVDSSLSGLWDHLFDRGEEHFTDFDNEPAPIGAWLEWALDDHPMQEELEDRLLEVIRGVAMTLIELAREDRSPFDPPTVASYVVAVAECLRLVADESVGDQYVAIANARCAAVPALARSLTKAMSDSSLIGYRGESRASRNGS